MSYVDVKWIIASARGWGRGVGLQTHPPAITDGARRTGDGVASSDERGVVGAIAMTIASPVARPTAIPEASPACSSPRAETVCAASHPRIGNVARS